MKIKVDTSPEAAAAAAAALGGAKDATAQAARERRRAAVENIKAGAAAARAGTATEVPVEVAAAPREPVESIEVELPNGAKVEFGPPSGVTLTDRLLAFFGGRDPSKAESAATTVAMCVRSVNGAPKQVVDPITRSKVLNEIGDDGLEILEHYYGQFWPRPTVADLKLIKKNYRLPR